jgi:pimeloyl-ACP methyl ester carboxylesterase
MSGGRASIVAACLLALALSGVAGIPLHASCSFEGDWLGWAYFEDGSDVPLRVRFSQGTPPLLRFDELARRQYDLPATIERCDSLDVIFARERPNGQVLRFEGRREGGTIQGTVHWADARGTFELNRSERLISRLAPETLQDLRGVYRLSPDRFLRIDSRPWGELIYSDYGSGRQGTLFPLDRDRFYAGAAMYLPSPATADLAVFRDADGKVDSLQWETNGRSLPGIPVRWSEEEISFLDSDLRLAGTVLRPEGDGPFPAAVVLGGSDWKLRDDARGDAEMLVAMGLATLIFDRRGNGASGGEAVHGFQADAEDAVAALKALDGRPGIAAERAGVAGRSQGGWIAPLAAAESPQVRFLLLFVPPAVSPAEQESTRRVNRLQDAGFPVDAIALETRLFTRSVEYAVTQRGWTDYAKLRAKAVSLHFPDDVLEAERPDDPDWTWGRYNWRYDPVPALRRVRCPVLALFGGADRNVVPAINLPRMKTALADAGNPDVTLLEIPGANHGLVAIPPEEAALPLHRHSTIGTRGWPDVARWIRDHLAVQR